jgi:hypothetical protein
MRINQSDVAMRDLLSQIDNLDAKKKRLRIAQSCQYGRVKWPNTMKFSTP